MTEIENEGAGVRRRGSRREASILVRWRLGEHLDQRRVEEH